MVMGTHDKWKRTDRVCHLGRFPDTQVKEVKVDLSIQIGVRVENILADGRGWHAFIRKRGPSFDRGSGERVQAWNVRALVPHPGHRLTGQDLSLRDWTTGQNLATKR